MAKQTALTSKVRIKQSAAIEKAAAAGWRVGDVIVTRYDYVKITAIRADKSGEVVICSSRSDDGKTWAGEGHASLRDFNYHHANDGKITGDIAEFEREALAEFARRAASGETDTGEGDESSDGNESAGTALVKLDKASLQSTKDALEAKANLARAMHTYIERHLSGFISEASALRKKIEKISKVIAAIETYLGVYEEVTQIADGDPAPADTAIAIRQQILFMAEEAAILSEDGGLDWRHIEAFDQWLIRDGHYRTLAPEEKCVVCFRPSRRKDYGDDPFYSAWMKEQNSKIYLLIRNGARLYRIYTDLVMGERLFPAEEEMLKVFAEAEKNGWGSDKEKAADREFAYKRNALLLQGILDRTDILQPMAHGVNLLDPDTYGMLLHLVRDAELSLSDGRLPYRQWREDANAQIKRGSRIFLAPLNAHWFWRKDTEWVERFLGWRRSIPDLPPSGVYEVDEVDGALVIRYLPKAEVYTGYWNPKARERRMAFIVKDYDDFVLNYDRLSLEDVERFIADRNERGNYLYMMPVLLNVRSRLRAEREWEAHFVTLVAARQNVDESAVWAQVDWWKYKNIWKRPISKDDAKALRMIEARVQRLAAGEALLDDDGDAPPPVNETQKDALFG